MEKINKIKSFKYSYANYGMAYGTVNCYGDGPIRDMLQEGIDSGDLPPAVYQAFHDLLLRLYKETGEMAVINVQQK